MEERKACAVLKARFERAGFHIEENRAFDEDGVQFEIDGFDPERRVGYEYITEEAGDGWDVDGVVIAALDAKRKAGDLHVLVVDERDAPDDASLSEAIDVFLDGLPKPKAKTATKKPAAKAKPKKATPAKKKR